MTTTSRPQYLSHTGAPAPAPTSGPGTYDYRYEFSETRKVLEEFFKAENEFPAQPSSGVSPGSQTRASYTDSSIHPDRKHQPRVTCHVSDTNPVPPPDMDLDYSLTRLEVNIILQDHYFGRPLIKTVFQSPITRLKPDCCSLGTLAAATWARGWLTLMMTLSLSSPSSAPPPPRSPSVGSCWTSASPCPCPGRPRPCQCLVTAPSLTTSKCYPSPLTSVSILYSSQSCGGPGQGSAAAAPRLSRQSELHPEPGDDRLRLRGSGERAERAECGGGLLPLLGAKTHLHAHPRGELRASEKT